jgi:DNA-directed RNA polymerase subunit RPC12/RpoP
MNFINLDYAIQVKFKEFLGIQLDKLISSSDNNCVSPSDDTELIEELSKRILNFFTENDLQTYNQQTSIASIAAHAFNNLNNKKKITENIVIQPICARCNDDVALPSGLPCPSCGSPRLPKIKTSVRGDICVFTGKCQYQNNYKAKTCMFPEYICGFPHRQ